MVALVRTFALLLAFASAASAAGPASVTNCILWLRADDLALADNAAVTSWTDASGNGRTATTASGTPRLRTNIQNSLPAVRFDGASNLVTSSFLTLTTDFTIVSLLRTITSDGVYFGSTAAPASGVFFAAHSALSNQISLGGASYASPRSATRPGGTVLQVARYDGTNIRVRNNRQEMVPVAVAGNPSIGITSGAASIGGHGIYATAGWMLTGDIFEIAIFNRALSDSEVLAVEAALCTKWNVCSGPRVLFVMDSLSNTHGANVLVPQSQAMNLLGNRNLHASVLGRSGLQMASCETVYGALIDSGLRSGETVYLVVEPCINDMLGGASAATLWATVKAFVNARAAVLAGRGGTMYLVLHTCTSCTLGSAPDGQAGYDSRRATYNALVRGWMASDFPQCAGVAVADAGGNVNLGQNNSGNSAAFFFDLVHPADQGNRLLAALDAAAILSLQGVKSVFVTVLGP